MYCILKVREVLFKLIDFNLTLCILIVIEVPPPTTTTTTTTPIIIKSTTSTAITEIESTTTEEEIKIEAELEKENQAILTSMLAISERNLKPIDSSRNIH